jgi:hypothetical protein
MRAHADATSLHAPLLRHLGDAIVAFGARLYARDLQVGATIPPTEHFTG